jgi:hypothetical protein
MVTQGTTVTTENWVDIITEFSLLPGTEYLVQNEGPGSLKITESVAEPTDSTFFHTMSPNSTRNIIIKADSKFWIKGILTSIDFTISEL